MPPTRPERQQPDGSRVTCARVEIYAADRNQPIEVQARIISASAAGLPIVEYQHADLAHDAPMPTLLCFSGGGCSGAVFALLAERCAAKGVRVVAFDMPGHTPKGLLGEATPLRSLISRVNGRVRRAATNAMVARWAAKSPHLDLLSHSAGIVDIARIAPDHGLGIGRFLICGAGLPGPAAMLIATRASTVGKSAEPLRLSSMVRHRLIPTGCISDHYGPASERLTGDLVLAQYHCAEHVGVPLSLLSSRPVMRRDWNSSRVLLIGSAGDPIAPPNRLMHTAMKLRVRGAVVAVEVLDSPCPHMFPSFDSPARRLAEIAADSSSS
jgi:pimeloyl-ACP methyl ester carboxylesterase